jgi:DNA primase
MAGRIFDEAEGPAVGGDFDPPKYINSPETDVYRKKEVLYGLHQAKGALRKTGEALLVEGYTDVIALHQAGVETAVATCGTALTAEQAKLLGRYAERVTLLYDADEAGTRATLRGMDRVLEAGLGAYAARLPEGRDPDDYVRAEGADRFRRFVRKRRQGVAAFRRARAERDGTFDTPEGQTRTMRAVADSLALIDDDMARENQVRAASDELDMYEKHLREAVEEARREDRQQEQRRRAPRPPVPDDAAPDEEPPEGEAPAGQEEAAPEPTPQECNLLRLLLERGRPMVELILGHMALTEFTDGPARELAGRFLEMYRDGQVEPRRALEGEFGPAIQQLAASVMTDAHEPSENWRERDINVPRLNQRAREAAASSMRLLKLRRVDEALEDAEADQVRAAATPEAEREAQQRVMRLQKLRQQIQRGEFFDWEE